MFVVPRLAPLGLAISGATPMAAAFVIGPTTAVPTFAAVATVAAARFALDSIARRREPARRPIPGLLPLWLFLLASAGVTLIAPFLFRTLQVLDPRGRLHPLGGPEALGQSSFAQLGYLLIGVLTVALIARSRTSGPWAIGLTLGIITLLSLWRLLYLDFGLPFPEGLFDGSPAFSYVDGAPGGIRRFRGILAEPSLLGTLSVATGAYAVARLRSSGVNGRVGWLAILAAAAVNGFNALSATFVLSALLTVGAAITVLTSKVLIGDGSRRVVEAVVIVVLLGVAWFAAPVITDFIQSSVSDKVSSSSYDERSSFDNHSWELLQRTCGFGVGVGANRASSFLANLAAASGLIGVALFVAAVLLIMRASLPAASMSPVRWSLFSLLVSKVLSSPDLGDSSGLLWTALGVLAAGAIRSHLAAEGGRAAAAGARPRSTKTAVLPPGSSRRPS